jgi:hypothetical protein
LLFEVDGIEYRLAAGTVRNKFLEFKRSGKIKFEYNSGIAFYTLKGYRFGKPVTPNHMGVGVGVNSNRSDPIVEIIQKLPMDRNAVHDIRLRFKVEGIWEFLSTYHPELHVNHNSKDILIPTWSLDGLLIRITVHKTDVISVLVGCSLTPVAADINGVIRLSNALTRVEERLAAILTDDDTSADHDWNKPYPVIVSGTGEIEHETQNNLRIPDHRGWIVTMWHFGRDSLVGYSGKKFEVTWEIGQHALVRAYTKIMRDKKIRIRLERQEYPNKTFPEAIEEKLNAGGGSNSL